MRFTREEQEYLKKQFVENNGSGKVLGYQAPIMYMVTDTKSYRNSMIQKPRRKK